MAYDIWATPSLASSAAAALATSALDALDGASVNNINYGVEEDMTIISNSCEVPHMASRRWYLVAVLGTSLSVVSLICNVLIARVLLRPKHSHFFFLGLLALSDSFLSFCYGPVIAMDIIKNRLQMLWLTRLWWGYVGPLLAMCHVSMTFSTFMIILGTIERYLITVKSKLLVCFRRNRSNAVFAMLALALILRGSAIFEIKLIKNGNCTGLSEYEPTLTPLVDSWLYETVFRFYIRTIATVFIPFFLLGYLNFRIVDTLRRQKRSAAMFRFATSDHKLKIRSATRLLVLIVCSYLVANCLNVFITAWEYVDLESTQTEFTYDIYETLTDVISMLYIMTCAIRFPLYILFNQEIRSAFYDFLFRPSERGSSHSHSHGAIGASSSSYASSYGGGGSGGGCGNASPSAYYTALTKNGRYLYNNHYYHSTNGHRNHFGIKKPPPANGYSKTMTHSVADSPTPNEKYGVKASACTKLQAYCISCLCLCCLEDDKYLCDGTTSVSDIAGNNRSPSTRRLSLSNCAPIGTDIDRFVVAMALARRFTSRQTESIDQGAHDRGRRCTVPPNMLLNHYGCGATTGVNYDETGGVYIGENKNKNNNNNNNTAKPYVNDKSDSNNFNNQHPIIAKRDDINDIEESIAVNPENTIEYNLIDDSSSMKRPCNVFNGHSRHDIETTTVIASQADSDCAPTTALIQCIAADTELKDSQQKFIDDSRIVIFENPLAKV